MWGNIFVEAIVQSNFNIGFSNESSDVLIHLAQWQYWWWFWFTFLWAFYYLTLLRVFRFRTLKFRPRLATTFRPHGKWGDLIVCVLPISWCANILTNANFILRMIEWQAESGLFTVRIRGKQWYWIYKFELKTFTDILSAPKNIGRNKWVIYTPGENIVADDYVHILQLRSQNKWIKKYWNKYLSEAKNENFSLVSPQEQLLYSLSSRLQELELDSLLLDNKFNIKRVDNCDNIYNPSALSAISRTKKTLLQDNAYVNSDIRVKNKSLLEQPINHDFENVFLNVKATTKINVKALQEAAKAPRLFTSRAHEVSTYHSKGAFLSNAFLNKFDSDVYNYYRNNDFVNVSRWLKRKQGVSSPIRIIKMPYDDPNGNVMRLKFNESESNIHQKPVPHTTYLTMKQKRYSRKKKILPRVVKQRDDSGKLLNTIKRSGSFSLVNNEILAKNEIDATKQYSLFRKNKVRFDKTSVILSRRMLRTRRTLVLPAHVNITAITNSYDVIHSWFIPGLGLKMDCIPGRATHHTFYIDNVGFYYGQCAEICGRYHHHMPIRICALPFEHFLIWWNNFGLPRLMKTPKKKRYQKVYSNRKYVW